MRSTRRPLPFLTCALIRLSRKITLSIPGILSIAGIAIVFGAAGVDPLHGQEEKLPVPPEVRTPTVEIPWNRFSDYPQVAGIMERLAKAYPRLTRLESIGKSVEGRDMWLLTVHAPGTEDDRSKPAMWVDGNIHGNEVQGGEACLYLAWYLLENYGRVPAITSLLDRASFYIMPMVNPDGRAWWFQSPNTPHSSRSGKRPIDNDRDGLLDEDGYDDLDGDGEILQMRKRDPHGRWKESPDDPRLMVRVKPGERGEWTLLRLEGIDNDGDGRVNEDGPGGYDMNRNWPSVWQPQYVQYGAGEHPFSFPETRAIGEFLIDHPNVAAVQSFHNSGGMILRGPGAKSFGSYPGGDVRVYDLIGKRGEKMLPFYRYMVIWKDLYTVYGGFVTWTYEGLGIISFTNELWSNKRLHGRGEPRASEQERIEFNDRLRSGIDFVPWKPFRHPEYGDIELGGWRKITGRVPPSFLIEEGSHRNALFCIEHAEQMPEVAISAVEVASLDGGRAQIDVEVTNERFIPTITSMTRQKRIGLPDLLELDGEGVRVVFSGIITQRYPERVRAVPHRPARILNRSGVSFTAPFRARFIVEGKGSFRITYRSQKAATVTAEGRIE